MPTETKNPPNNLFWQKVKFPALLTNLPLISKIGLLLIATAFLFVSLNLFPVIKQETIYTVYQNSIANNKATVTTEILPVDPQFSIVVNKINANAKVIENVDYKDSSIYQKALTQGVAHATGTATPDKFGNVFLFAHSSDNFFNANKYNSVFYLLHHLNINDTFDIYYKNAKYEYSVISKQIVDPSKTDFLNQPKDQHIATLMTCWPPGTTFGRLIIQGRLK